MNKQSVELGEQQQREHATHSLTAGAVAGGGGVGAAVSCSKA